MTESRAPRRRRSPRAAEAEAHPDARGAAAVSPGRRAGSRFSHAATTAALIAGRPTTFALAVFGLVVWAVSGPLFGYSNTWQLVVNTATTIITFLMVFLIQNTQNRDTASLHIKLDELIRVTRGARNTMMALGDFDDDELEQLRDGLERRGRSGTARQRGQSRKASRDDTKESG